MFIHFLFAPINLLFLLNALLFIYLTPFFWRSFFKLRCVAEQLLKLDTSKDLAALSLVLLPLLLIPLPLFYLISLSSLNGDHFYTFYSLSVKLNLLLMLVSTITLLIAKKIDYKSTRPLTNTFLSALLYLIIFYFSFIIIIAATMVICLNTFPDGVVWSNSMINYKLLFAVYFAHLLCLSLIILLTAKQRTVLFLLYFLGQSYLNYTWFGHLYYAF